MQVDYQGNVIASITRVTTDDGRPLQLAVTRDGQSFNFTTGEGSAVQPYPVRMDWGLLDALLEKARAGRTVTRADEIINGRAAWVFIFTDSFDEPINFGDGKNVTRLENRMSVDAESGAYLSSELIKYFEDGSQSLDSQQTVVTEERVDQPPDDALALFNHERTVYTPPAAGDSLGVAGRDFSRSDLKLVSLPGDDFSMPTFWYGDIYAGDAYLGRVDFGATPGGWCERSASGETLAFKRETILNSRAASTTLNWFGLSDLRQVYVASEALQVTLGAELVAGGRKTGLHRLHERRLRAVPAGRADELAAAAGRDGNDGMAAAVEAGRYAGGGGGAGCIPVLRGGRGERRDCLQGSI